jgi:trk system potassium uptake protein
MRIIVIGAGEVGFDVAKLLSSQVHDVTVIDLDRAKLDALQERLDIRVIEGSGTSADVLTRAGAKEADLLVAVTAVDEVNLIACMLADRMGTGSTIARVRSGEFTHMKSVLQPEDFGIGHIIHPEESAALEIVRLVKRASATDVQTFAEGRAQLVGLRITDQSPAADRTVESMSSITSGGRFLVVGISRGERTILPRGTERIRRGDHIFVLGLTSDMPRIMTSFVSEVNRLRDIMVLGGDRIGAQVAFHLSKDRHRRLKLIEGDRKRAEQLADSLEHVLVIHGDPTDVDLLAVEGIGEMDAVLSVTPNEESNLVMCLLAKHLGVKKTVALLSKPAYVPIGERIGLDAAVNVKKAISREVLRFIRGSNVLSVATVAGLDVEMLEVTVGEGSRMSGKRIRDVTLPDGILFGLVKGGMRVDIATGDTTIRVGDVVTAFIAPKRLADLRRILALDGD